jgi:hypothetical protein
MGSKATTINFKFWPNLKFCFYLPHTQYAAKNHKPSKSGIIWLKNRFFFPDPKSHTQMGSLTVDQKTRAKNSHAWAPLTALLLFLLLFKTKISILIQRSTLFSICWKLFYSKMFSKIILFFPIKLFYAKLLLLNVSTPNGSNYNTQMWVLNGMN